MGFFTRTAMDALMKTTHPEINRRQCWNLHPHRKPCTTCKDICPYGEEIFSRPNLVKDWDPPALPDSVHFCGVIGYFHASIIQIVYFVFSRHNAAASVLFSRLVRRAENVRLYFGHLPQKRSLRPARPITIKVQRRRTPRSQHHPHPGSRAFLDLCCFSR